MAVISAFLPTLSSLSSSTKLHQTVNNVNNFILAPNFAWKFQIRRRSNFASSTAASSYRTYRGRFTADEEDDEFGSSSSFNEAVELFNSREYYKCHDVLEALWNESEEPARTLVHGILQCAVGFHHLFNQVFNFQILLLLYFFIKKIKIKISLYCICLEPQGCDDGIWRRSMQAEKNEL